MIPRDIPAPSPGWRRPTREHRMNGINLVSNDRPAGSWDVPSLAEIVATGVVPLEVIRAGVCVLCGFDPAFESDERVVSRIFCQMLRATGHASDMSRAAAAQ